MNELATIPTSIRQRLERADALLRQGQSDTAEAVLQQAHIELARSQPELAALLMAAQTGYRGITATTTEQLTSMERRERTFLGFPIGGEWVPTITTRVVTKTLRLF